MTYFHYGDKCVIDKVTRELRKPTPDDDPSFILNYGVQVVQHQPLSYYVPKPKQQPVYLLERFTTDGFWQPVGVYSSHRKALEAAEEKGIDEESMGITEWEVE